MTKFKENPKCVNPLKTEINLAVAKTATGKPLFKASDGD